MWIKFFILLGLSWFLQIRAFPIQNYESNNFNELILKRRIRQELRHNLPDPSSQQLPSGFVKASDQTSSGRTLSFAGQPASRQLGELEPASPSGGSNQLPPPQSGPSKNADGSQLPAQLPPPLPPQPNPSPDPSGNGGGGQGNGRRHHGGGSPLDPNNPNVGQVPNAGNPPPQTFNPNSPAGSPINPGPGQFQPSPGQLPPNPGQFQPNPNLPLQPSPQNFNQGQQFQPNVPSANQFQPSPGQFSPNGVPPGQFNPGLPPNGLSPNAGQFNPSGLPPNPGQFNPSAGQLPSQNFPPSNGGLQPVDPSALNAAALAAGQNGPPPSPFGG